MEPESRPPLGEQPVRSNQREADHGPAPDQMPRQLTVPEETARQTGKQLRLGGGEFLAANAAGRVIVQQLQDGRHDQRGHGHAADLHDLLAAGRGADQLAGLEIVAHITGCAGRTAHHRSHAQDGQHAGRARKAKQDQQQPGSQHGGDGHARDRAVGVADQADDITGHRGKKERHDEHDRGGRQGHVQPPGKQKIDTTGQDQAAQSQGADPGQRQILRRVLSLCRPCPGSRQQRPDGLSQAAPDLPNGHHAAHDHGADPDIAYLL